MLRSVARHGAVAGQWLTPPRGVRWNSALSSSIKITSVPAPHAGSITVLSLNRPNARNALSTQLLTELSDVVEGLHRERGKGSTRALIVASQVDSAFCAGADLKERAGMSPADVSKFLTTLRNTFSRLASLPIPTIAAINSSAFGGGLELGLCTHFRVLASTATVALPETRLAIIPGAGGTYRLPALIGPSRARDMILTGRRIQGAEAYFMGLADRLVEVTEEEQDKPGVARQKVLDTAVMLARDICDGGPVAIRAAMQAIDGWEEGEKSENRAYELTLPTDDRVEALRAFADKRKPVFKGR